jgi:hypothetical protein
MGCLCFGRRFFFTNSSGNLSEGDILKKVGFFCQANASYHQYEWSILESLKQSGLSAVARLALRLVTSIQPQQVKQLVAELRGADLKPKRFEEVSEAAKVFALPTPSNLSLDSSVCVFLLINYFLECLKVAKYVGKDQNDLEADLVYLLARAILVSLGIRGLFFESAGAVFYP